MAIFSFLRNARYVLFVGVRKRQDRNCEKHPFELDVSFNISYIYYESLMVETSVYNVLENLVFLNMK